MNFNGLKTALTRAVSSSVTKVKANSPLILTVTGGVGVVATAALSAKGALKTAPDWKQLKQDLNDAEQFLQDKPEVYDVEAYRKDVALMYTQFAIKTVKNFAPAIVVGVGTIAAFCGSYGIMKERNAALTSTVTGLQTLLTNYRDEIKRTHGEDEEKAVFARASHRVDDETGQVTSKSVVDPSIYARFFDPFCPNWSKRPEYNLVFLKAQQNFANDMLKAKGVLFLNEVYDMLGFERTRAGACVGWVAKPGKQCFVDFGIYDIKNNPEVSGFVNGEEASILLDFNVDGVVLDELKD